MATDGAEKPATQAEVAVLEVLRGCCTDAAIIQHSDVLKTAPAVVQAVLSGDRLLDAIRDAIEDAVDALPTAERQAVRVMAGLEPGWESSRAITREERKVRMGVILHRAGDRGGDGLSSRRVEQVQVDDLAPAVTRLLFDPRLRRRPMMRDRPIFAQFINPEFLALHHQEGLLKEPDAVRQRLEYVARIALLTSRAGLVLPASYVFEVPGVADFVAHVPEVSEAGAIQFSAPASGLGEYRSIKAPEYRDDANNPYAAIHTSPVLDRVPWRPRHGSSAGQSIADAWSQEVRPGAALTRVVEAIVKAQGVTYRVAERRLARVPERLDGRALVARFVLTAINVPVPPSGRYAVGWMLSNKYLESYLTDLDATVLVDFPFGSFTGLVGGTNRRQFSAARITRVLRLLGIDSALLLQRVDWRLLLALRETVELDVLLPSLYEDNTSTGQWLKVASFRRKKSPPDVSRDPSGYISWLGDVVDAVA